MASALDGRMFRAAIYSLLATTAASYSVPTEIGTPSPIKSPTTKPQTLADVAADVAVIKQVKLRPLNLDFVPRVGWRGTVFPSVLSPILSTILASFFALWLHDETGFNGIDSTPHVIGGVLVSFLTVFRTQQAYGRYWEGRGHIGKLMAGVVDVASMGAVQFDGERPAEAAAAREELARLLRLYFRETVTFLRSTSKTTKSVSNYWLAEDVIEDVVNTAIGTDGSLVLNTSEATPAEEARLRGLARPPVLVLQWVRAHIYRAGVEKRLVAGRDDAERTRTILFGLDKLLSELQPAFNGAAKIATTPVRCSAHTFLVFVIHTLTILFSPFSFPQAPQPYTQMSRWLVFWFIYTMPLALLGKFGGASGIATLEAKINPVWASIVPARDISLAFIPAVMLLAFGYYGLDYCANQLQNPFIAEFGDVQLDGRFANAVCEDIDMLLLCETPGVVEPTREAEPKLVA